MESVRRAELPTQIDPAGPIDVTTELDAIHPGSGPVRPDLGLHIGHPADHSGLPTRADVPIAADPVSLVGRTSETEADAQTETIEVTETGLPAALDEAEAVSRPSNGSPAVDEPLSPMSTGPGGEPPLALERPLNRRPVRDRRAPEAPSSHAPILEAPQRLPIPSRPDPLPSATAISSSPSPVTRTADVISLISYRDRRSPTPPGGGPIGDSSPLPLAAGIPPIARTALAGHRAALTATAGLPLAVGFGALPQSAPTPVPEIRAIEARALATVPRSTSKSATSSHEQSTEVPRMAQSDSAMPVVPAGAGRSNPAPSDVLAASTTASAPATPQPAQPVAHEISGPAAAVPAIASAAAAAVPGTGMGMDAAALDALARQLYEPLVRRLRAELRLDREREGTLMDRPW